jgi:parallel beta helix pectate lyase-like protein
LVLHAGGHRLLNRICFLAVLAVAAGCGGGGDRAQPAAAGPAPRAHAASTCDRYAAPNGSRRGRGSRAHPYGSLSRLLRGLRRGQVGCLMAGRYSHRGTVAMRRPGTTLRPLGRARVTIDGAIWVLSGAKGARITGLTLTSHDPVYSIPLKIQADDFSLVGNDITAARNTSCVLVGADRTVSHAVIELNSIHRCGRTGKLSHLLYVTHSRGAVIRNNLLFDNPGGWAVHLYPDADGTLIEGNVIDSNEGGVIFAGDGSGDTSDGNVVRENVITHSDPRWNIESSWSGGPEGRGNLAERNCLYSAGAGAPSGIGFANGFAPSGNVVATGRVYVDRRAGNYRLRRGSGCGTVLTDVGGAKLRAGPR